MEYGGEHQKYACVLVECGTSYAYKHFESLVFVERIFKLLSADCVTKVPIGHSRLGCTAWALTRGGPKRTDREGTVFHCNDQRRIDLVDVNPIATPYKKSKKRW